MASSQACSSCAMSAGDGADSPSPSPASAGASMTSPVPDGSLLAGALPPPACPTSSGSGSPPSGEFGGPPEPPSPPPDCSAVTALVGRVATVGYRSAGRIRAGTSPAVRWTAVAGVIFVRLRQAVVGFLDADPVPGLGVGRQGEAGVPQQPVGDQLGGALPAFRVAFAAPRVVLEGAGQHHTRDRGLDDVGVGLRDPLRRIADLAPVARQRLAAGVGADRQGGAPGCRRRAARGAAR